VLENHHITPYFTLNKEALTWFEKDTETSQSQSNSSPNCKISSSSLKENTCQLPKSCERQSVNS